MQNVESIYQQSIKPLPIRDQVRLAELIMERAHAGARPKSGRTSALELLESLKIHRSARSSDDIEKYLRTERDSWDN